VASIQSALSYRGPDSQSRQDVSLWSGSETSSLTLVANTLHLRGPPTQQPFVDDDENVLLWNGEIYGGIQVGSDENDTAVLSRRLRSCKDGHEIHGVLSVILGEWAIIYWQKHTRTLFFARDAIGRRSLLCLVVKGEDSSQSPLGLVISSVSTHSSSLPASLKENTASATDTVDEDGDGEHVDQSPWQELPPNGVYALSFSADSNESVFSMQPWCEDNHEGSLWAPNSTSISPSLSINSTTFLRRLRF